MARRIETLPHYWRSSLWGAWVRCHARAVRLEILASSADRARGDSAASQVYEDAMGDEIAGLARESETAYADVFDERARYASPDELAGEAEVLLGMVDRSSSALARAAAEMGRMVRDIDGPEADHARSLAALFEEG